MNDFINSGWTVSQIIKTMVVAKMMPCVPETLFLFLLAHSWNRLSHSFLMFGRVWD